MIEYEQITTFAHKVRLDGKSIGHIHKRRGQKNYYQYLPLGQKCGGLYYPTIDLCKHSLGEHEAPFEIELVADRNGVVQTIIGCCFIDSWTKHSSMTDTVMILSRMKVLPHKDFIVSQSMGISTNVVAAQQIIACQAAVLAQMDAIQDLEANAK